MDEKSADIDPTTVFRLDIIFRRFYMLGFFFFNAVYWALLAHYSQQQANAIEKTFNDTQRIFIDFEGGSTLQAVEQEEESVEQSGLFTFYSAHINVTFKNAGYSSNYTYCIC